MKQCRIELNGCDDSTRFDMELTEEEYKLLCRVAEESEKTSTYGCMPTMTVCLVEPKQ